MGWLFVPSDPDIAIRVHASALTVPVELAKGPRVSSRDELEDDAVAEELSFVHVKNRTDKNVRATLLLALIKGQDQSEAVRGDVAIVRGKGGGAPFVYADLTSEECARLALYFAPPELR